MEVRQYNKTLHVRGCPKTGFHITFSLLIYQLEASLTKSEVLVCWVHFCWCCRNLSNPWSLSFSGSKLVMLEALRCLHRLVLFWFLGWSQVGKWTARTQRIESTCNPTGSVYLIPPGDAWWWSNLRHNQLKPQTLRSEDFLVTGFLETTKRHPTTWPFLTPFSFEVATLTAWFRRSMEQTSVFRFCLFHLFLQETNTVRSSISLPFLIGSLSGTLEV